MRRLLPCPPIGLRESDPARLWPAGAALAPGAAGHRM